MSATEPRSGRRRKLIMAALVVVALVVCAGAAALASAVLDRPRSATRVDLVIRAQRADVWNILVDLDSYGAWNPLIRSARGELVEGQTLDLTLAEPDGGMEDAEVEVTSVREGRKLRWKDRLFGPGVRDREYEIRLEPLEPGVVRVIAQEAYEGLLVPFESLDGQHEELTSMLEALKTRAEESAASAVAEAQ
jgi:hypothetical protein